MGYFVGDLELLVTKGGRVALLEALELFDTSTFEQAPFPFLIPEHEYRTVDVIPAEEYL